MKLDPWPRREVYQFFSGLSNPFYSVCFRQDVTKLYRYVKARGLSFYYSLIWCCTRAMDSVEAFHVALREGEPVRLPGRRPSFTDIRPGAEDFHIVTLGMEEDLAAFCRAAGEKNRSQTAFTVPDSEGQDLIYYSCMPWVDMTSVTHERDFSAPGARDDSVPRVTWGKYVREGEQLVLGLSLEVNHRLIDGSHIGQFARELTAQLDRLNRDTPS